MYIKKLNVLVGLAVITALVLTACGSTKANDKVTVQLSWFHTVEFAGFYAAVEKGFYAEENLDVTLVPGGATASPITEVNEGRAQFGVTTGDSIIVAQSAGQNLVAVSSIFRQNPLAVMTLSDSGISQPQDLVGKNVGVITADFSTTWDIQFLAMLKKMGVDQGSMNFSAVEDYHGANELTSGKTDAQSGVFSTNEPVVANLDGNNVHMIFYKDFGIEMYANNIFTTGSLISENPDLVARFVRATLRGYQYALENTDEVAAMALKYDETLDLEVQKATMRAQIPLLDTGDAPIGWMDEDTWQVTQEILLDFAVIPNSVDLTSVYTNEFIPQ